MSKIHRQFIDLIYGSPTGLRAEDIPFDGTNSISVHINTKLPKLAGTNTFTEHNTFYSLDITNNGIVANSEGRDHKFRIAGDDVLTVSSSKIQVRGNLEFGGSDLKIYLDGYQNSKFLRFGIDTEQFEFNSSVAITGPSHYSFNGNGSGLTNLNASYISQGILNKDRLPGFFLKTLAGGISPENGFLSFNDVGNDVYRRSIQGTSDNIVVTDGDGYFGNPTLDVGSNIPKLNSNNVFTGNNSFGSTGIDPNLGEIRIFTESNPNNFVNLSYYSADHTLHISRKISTNGLESTDGIVNFGPLDNYGNIHLTGGQLRMNITGRSTINFGQHSFGVSLPSTNANGLKIKLYGNPNDNTISAGEYGIGIESGHQYYITGNGYKWYASNSLSSLAMTLNISNTLTVLGDIVTNHSIKTGGFSAGLRQITATSTTLSVNDHTLFINAASGNRTIILPTSTSPIGQTYYATVINAGIHNAVIFNAGSGGYIHSNTYSQTQTYRLGDGVRTNHHKWFKIVKIDPVTWSIDMGLSEKDIIWGTDTIASGTRLIECYYFGHNYEPNTMFLASYAGNENNGGPLTVYQAGFSLYARTTNNVTANTEIIWRILKQ